MNTVRIATLQYFIRPVADEEAFKAQVTGLVAMEDEKPPSPWRAAARDQS